MPKDTPPTPEPDAGGLGAALGAFAAQDPGTCGVAFCPVSMLLTAAGTVRPEVVEHLVAAGRELLLAMTAILDARADAMARSSPLEHIEIG